jgi:ATPase subunit of ABC transporter with duplicated ATPase domains
MITLNNVTISNKKDHRILVKNFNFTLNPGDKAVIIGEEGNGKSTLLKYIYNPHLLDPYCDYTGNQLGTPKKGYLAQEISEDLLEYTVGEFLSHFEIYTSSNSDIWTMNLDLGKFSMEQKISTLSGGEKVKLRLMALLAEEPDILLLDEPTNDLDMNTLEWLENFINHSKCPILYVSHDETLIENTANIIIHMEQLKKKRECRYTIERMSYADYVNTRLKGLEKQEMVARKQRENYKSQMTRFQQVYNRDELVQDRNSTKLNNVKSMEKRIEKGREDFLEIPDVEEAILFGFPTEIEIPNGKTIIDYSLDKLKIEQDEKEKILAEGIHLQVMGPERIAIIGNNGIGKTTFLRKVAEELLKRSDIKAGYMSQNYDELLDFDKRPIEFLVSSGQKEDITKAFTYMGGMKFTRDEMEHKIGELSGGQKAKLILLKMILEGCNVLILDEPTRNLSPLSNPVIRGALSEFGGTIISITHDRKYIGEVCTQVYELTKTGLLKCDSKWN